MEAKNQEPGILCKRDLIAAAVTGQVAIPETLA